MPPPPAPLQVWLSFAKFEAEALPSGDDEEGEEGSEAAARWGLGPWLSEGGGQQAKGGGAQTPWWATRASGVH